MADLIKFKIITPERVVFSDEVSQITVMTKTGEITILPHHIPLVSLMQPGELRYVKNGEEKLIAVSTGFIEVKPKSEVVILADTAEHATEIDLARAEEARAKAASLMSSARFKDDVEYVTLQASMEKALSRLRVGNKYRKISSSK
ncbi:MAG: F0F1 ATP synthase subunit epsilon [Candidatus Magasanikbacteria bacterium]|nr:F0F1 ATP synthase subunit epsilon [Candidatus Magasanikbacteria bacterium]